ncbi:hypothetical protein VNO80_07806 [Phaseolus coccineus]|uniref:Uncharacterized protein n=1 Tax=Phaseolus coccineus TaxID=3886 RepID=A0AAN9RIT7_PHACN
MKSTNRSVPINNQNQFPKRASETQRDIQHNKPLFGGRKQTRVLPNLGFTIPYSKSLSSSPKSKPLRRKGESFVDLRKQRAALDAMTGKAKPKKHTAKEIAAKIDAATTNRGGGKAGQADRSGVEKGGHAKYECPLCKVTAPDVKSMQIHHEARHPKIPFEEEKVANLHASNAPESSKVRPGIRGSKKK